jgi:hypothetical protein
MRATERGNRLDRRITIFSPEPDGHWSRTDEHHVVHLYDPDELRAALERIGFTVETRERYGEDHGDSTPPAGWTVVVATKPG